MKIEDIRVFEGRNIYSHKKCIRMNVDLEGYSNISSKEIEGDSFKLCSRIKRALLLCR